MKRALFCICFLLAPVLLGQQPGTLRWRIVIGNPSSSAVTSSPALAPDGTIYIANGYYSGTSASYPGRSLYSISPIGQTNWIFNAGGYLNASPAIGPDGTIYIGCTDGALYSVSPTGGTNWLFRTRGNALSSAAIGADSTIYIAAVSNFVDELYSIQPDGSSNWVFHMVSVGSPPINSAQFPAPAIGPDGTIYVGSLTNVYAVSPTGRSSWTYRLGTVTYSSPGIGADGTVYIGSDDYILHALAPDGHQRWQYATGSYMESSPAIDSDGTIYAASLDHYTYALTSAGKLLWRVTGFSSSPALAANGNIYVAGAVFDELQAFNHSGSNIWNFNLASTAPVFSSPVVAADGTIYVAAGFYLYAVYGDSPLQPGPWSMFRREPLHTARSTQRALTQPTVLSDGSFAMTLGTETGLTYRVQATVDFANWTNLYDFAPTNFTSQFIDFDATNFPNRYYRLAVP